MDVRGGFEREFVRMTVSTMDPHTTAGRARVCVDCHQNPKTLGLGNGQVVLRGVSERGGKGDDPWDFVPAVGYGKGGDGAAALAPFVKIDGTSVVRSSRKWLRTFNSSEIDRILDAGRCVGCHDRYDDPVMRMWQPGKMPPPGKRCLVFGMFNQKGQ
jgi:hypothetical protein